MAFKLHFVTQVGGLPSQSRKELDTLLRQGWEIIDQDVVDEWTDSEGYSSSETKYKLQKND